MIINAGIIWDVLNSEAHALHCNENQHASLRYLRSLVGLMEGDSFAHLKVEKVEDMLSFMLQEVDSSLEIIANGTWMRVTIEEDGYIVLTGSHFDAPVTTQPPVTK